MLALLVPVLVGLIGYGSLKSDVRHVQAEVDRRAPQAVVDAKLDAIIQRLERIERKLDRP